MTLCYRCDNPLTDKNQSVEHIIPNACGGRLKSKNLLCKTCNSFYGESFDKELASQVNFFINYLDIKKDRGHPQDIPGVYSHSGQDAILLKGGKHKHLHPKVEIDDNKQSTILNVRADNYEELKKILTSLKRRYPKLNIEEVLSKSKNKKENEPISFVLKLGGVDSYKAVIKSLINFFIFNGGEIKFIKHLIPYLDGKNDYNKILLYVPEPPIYKPMDGEVSHVIKVIGDSEQKILYAYIELFNTYSYLAILNETYDEKSIDYTYGYDLLLNSEIKVDILLNANKSALIAFFNQQNNLPSIRIQQRFLRISEIAMDRLYQKHVQKIISEEVELFSSVNPHVLELPESINIKIENRIATEIKNQQFRVSELTTEAPPTNLKERNTWLFNKIKHWFE